MTPYSERIGRVCVVGHSVLRTPVPSTFTTVTLTRSPTFRNPSVFQRGPAPGRRPPCVRSEAEAFPLFRRETLFMVLSRKGGYTASTMYRATNHCGNTGNLCRKPWSFEQP